MHQTCVTHLLWFELSFYLHLSIEYILQIQQREVNKLELGRVGRKNKLGKFRLTYFSLLNFKDIFNMFPSSDGSVVSFQKTAVAVLASVVVFLKTAVTVLMRLC